MDKEKGLKLFGVRIEAPEEEEEEVMRKSYSMGNLASCAASVNQMADHGNAVDHGYLSDGGLIQNSSRRGGQERKRGEMIVKDMLDFVLDLIWSFIFSLIENFVKCTVSLILLLSVCNSSGGP